jgi:LmbE family N-acetylglucosaminyl deacetylase
VDLEPFPEDWQRAMAVVAHPDDMEYGAAAAVAGWTDAGRTVVYVLATSGEAGIDGRHPSEVGPLREAEERAGAAEVGVDVVEFLGHRDGVIEYGLDLRRDIARAIRRHRPEVLVTLAHDERAPWGGFGMADHRVVGLAAIDAARDAANRWVFTELLDEGLEPWTGLRWLAIAAAARPTHAVDVTGSIDRGVASLRQHRAYLEGLTDPTDPDVFLRQNATATGESFGGRLAVAFELVGL